MRPALSFAIASIGLPLVLICPATAQDGSRVALYRKHYSAVELELRGAATDHLSDEQRSRRSALLDHLSAYQKAGVFGVNTADPERREPHFVDATGRRCAVAHLLHVTGHDDLVADVAANSNDLFVAELAGEARFEAWLSEVGLSFAEATRIQLPLTGGRSGPDDSGGGGSSTAPPPRTGGSSGSAPTTSGPTGPDTSGPATPPSGGGRAVTPGAPGGPRIASTPSSIEVESQAWSLWWEFNKLGFLQPNRLRLQRGPATPGDGTQLPVQNLLRREQDLVRPSLINALADPVAEVRSSAAVALGRIGGAQAVAHLLPLLSDSAVSVREHAIFALGATGSDAAAEVLLSIAASGTPSERSRERVSPDSQALALVALGLGRRRGMDESIDAEVAALLRRRPKATRVMTGLGSMLFETLHPSVAVGTWATRWAADTKEPTVVRARAVENMRVSQDPKAVASLTQHLNGRRIELRRSAAFALGDLDHALSAPTLKTAFELENEVITRGFILISLGQTGGEGTTAFLTRALEKESAPLRPWCALALGLVAREQDDVAARAARAAIRAGYAAESSAAARGAYLLAAGLGGDAEALPMLLEGLTAKQVPLRAHAALALALLGGEQARDALAARMVVERSDFVRTNIAHALGCIGDPRDGELLVATLTRLNNPQLKSVAAVALSYHGSRDAVQSLFALTRDQKVGDATRAAAFQALGLMLEGEPQLDLALLSRQSNFTAFPEWTLRVLQIAL